MRCNLAQFFDGFLNAPIVLIQLRFVHKLLPQVRCHDLKMMKDEGDC